MVSKIIHMPAGTKQVFVQYQPELVVSCLLPSGKKKAGPVDYARTVQAPSILWVQYLRNNLEHKAIRAYKIVKKEQKKISVATKQFNLGPLPHVGNGSVCWGHGYNLRKPKTLKEANTRYWTTSFGSLQFNYGSFGGTYSRDISIQIIGKKSVAFNKVKALLISDSKHILNKFPKKMWKKAYFDSQLKNLIIIPISYKDGVCAAKVGTKKIEFTIDKKKQLAVKD